MGNKNQTEKNNNLITCMLTGIGIFGNLYPKNNLRNESNKS